VKAADVAEYVIPGATFGFFAGFFVFGWLSDSSQDSHDFGGLPWIIFGPFVVAGLVAVFGAAIGYATATFVHRNRKSDEPPK
jgi:ABC-type phosphate transport system permease subunit